MSNVIYTHRAQTFTTLGSASINVDTGQQIVFFWNVKGNITGSSPSLQFSLVEVDPSDRMTQISTPVAGSPITGPGYGHVILSQSLSPIVLVSWTLSGSGASFGGVDTTFTYHDIADSVVFNSGSLTVSSSGTQTVFQSNPAMLNATVTGSLALSQSPMMLQGTNPWIVSSSILHNVTGTVTLGLPPTVNQGTSPWIVSSSQTFTVQGAPGGQAVSVSGTVTSNQGTPNTLANAWPHLIVSGGFAAQIFSSLGLSVAHRSSRLLTGSYHAAVTQVTGATAQENLMSIENPSASTVTVFVKRVQFMAGNSGTSPNTHTVYRLARTSAITAGGAVVTAQKRATSDAVPQAIVRQSPSGSIAPGSLWAGDPGITANSAGNAPQLEALRGQREDDDIVLVAGEALMLIVGANDANWRHTCVIEWTEGTGGWLS